VTQTTGGKAWQAAALSCPPGGPCLRWGPAPTGTGSCAMSDYPQPIERSTDGGRTWGPAYDPAAGDLANGCDFNALVALGPQEALLVGRGAGSGAPAVHVTVDGGQTWTAVALPALPAGVGSSPQGVRLLPDGALLAVTSSDASGQQLDLLPPGASAWCAVPGIALQGIATSAGSVQAIGSRLFWIQEQTQGLPTVRSVALSAVHC